MEILCPVCNGLESITKTCPRCSHKMSEMGSIDNYLGPYSPYQDLELMELSNGLYSPGPDPCMHLLYCESCRVEKKVLIDKITL